MIYLLDSHVLVWAIYRQEKLSRAARFVLEDLSNDLLVSDASLWELLSKVGRGKLRFTSESVTEVAANIDMLGVQYLAVSHAHVISAAELPFHHADPFDRMLVAQAIELGIPLVSADPMMKKYNAQVLW